MRGDKIKKLVRKRYGNIADGGSDCGCDAESSCCGGEDFSTDALETLREFGYDADKAVEFFGSGGAAGLSCGNPIGIAGIEAGETVLDLGSGMGFDCYLASLAVGESGRVIGVDMTPEMVDKARAKLEEEGAPGNIEFRLGEIEELPIEDDSIDVIISNCVINLSPDKRSVFREAYRVLRSGGRLAVSDVIAIRPLPAELAGDPEMHCSCIAGAVTEEELSGLLTGAGFEEIEIRQKAESRRIVDGWAPGRHAGDYIVSAEIRARKP